MIKNESCRNEICGATKEFKLKLLQGAEMLFVTLEYDKEFRPKTKDTMIISGFKDGDEPPVEKYIKDEYGIEPDE